MYPNYNYFPQNQQPQQQQNRQQIMYLKGRPVSSIEEVKAIPIDFDGSIFYFPDMANKRIYTKQINLDGTASIYMYEFKMIPTTPLQQEPQVPDLTSYVTRDEFNSVLEQIKEMLPKEKVNNNPPPIPVKKEDIKF